MEWLHGPISDQAVFWFGWKVFWWKRAVTFAQLILGSAIFLNVVTAERKRRLHVKLEQLRDKTAKIAVPSVVRVRTILKYLLPAIAVVAAICTLLTPAALAKPLALWGIYLAWVFLLFAMSAPLVSIALSVSTAWASAHATVRYVPRILESLLHHERFDRNVAIMVFALLVLVTSLQIYLS